MATQFMVTQEGTIAYDDAGEGALVIGVPGIGDLRGSYRFLQAQLVKAGFRVVTMDVRGHGESSTRWSDFSVAGVGADMLALIRHLNGGPAVLVGASMAAGAAVWAAAEAPELVHGLVLLGPFVRGETSGSNRLMYSALFARPWGPSLWVKYFSSLFPTRKPADFAQYSAALKANLGEPGRLEATKQMMQASKAASEERLARVTEPVLVLMGSKDPDFKDPEAEAAWVAEQLRGTYGMIAGAGHYPHVEMPEETGSIIVDFLRSLSKESEGEVGPHVAQGRS